MRFPWFRRKRGGGTWTPAPRAHGVYLSARVSRREELRRYRADLEEFLGVEVTARWLDGAGGFDAAGWNVVDGVRVEADPATAARFAAADLADVARARYFVAFTDEPGAVGAGRGGRHVELGYAFALCEVLLVVGPCEHVFHHADRVIRCRDWGEALWWITMDARR